MPDIILPEKPGGYEAAYANGFFELATIQHVLSLNRQIAPVRVASTTNLNSIYNNGTDGVGATLTNSSTQAALMLDGVAVNIGDAVLIKDQTNKAQNGIYIVSNVGSVSTNWVLTRIGTYDSVSRIRPGDVIPVVTGSANQVTFFMLISNIVTIGTSDFIFSKVNGSSLTAISGTANQIAVTIVDGVPTISLASNPILPGTGSVTIPFGPASERPSNPTVAMIRFCTDLQTEY